MDTQGKLGLKLELKKYRKLDAIYLNGKCICKMAFEEYAKELVKRWNCHQALLEVCKEAKKEIYEAINQRPNTLSITVRHIEAAIAVATE